MDDHANIGHLDDVAPQVIDHGDLQGERRRPAPEFAPHAIGCSAYKQGPGQRAMPVHVHADEVELGEDRLPLTPGSLVGRPPATGVEHLLRAGPEDGE